MRRPIAVLAMALAAPAGAALPTPDKDDGGIKLPPQGMLDDQQVADVLNYAREIFAKTPSTITDKDVAAQRAKP
jgi:hypothetical protein